MLMSIAPNGSYEKANFAYVANAIEQITSDIENFSSVFQKYML